MRFAWNDPLGILIFWSCYPLRCILLRIRFLWGFILSRCDPSASRTFGADLRTLNTTTILYGPKAKAQASSRFPRQRKVCSGLHLTVDNGIEVVNPHQPAKTSLRTSLGCSYLTCLPYSKSAHAHRVFISQFDIIVIAPLSKQTKLDLLPHIQIEDHIISCHRAATIVLRCT